MLIDLNNEEIECITGICKRAIIFDEMGIVSVNAKDVEIFKKLLIKLTKKDEN